MASNFPEDFYIFLTPKDDNVSKNDNSLIQILDNTSKYSEMIFRINYIKIDKKIIGGYELKFDYDIIKSPKDKNVKTTGDDFTQFVGDIILDIWERFYT